jgi:hypothetical protein
VPQAIVLTRNLPSGAASLTVAPRVYPGTFPPGHGLDWQLPSQDDFQTLSTNGVNEGDYLSGWFYVPELPDDGDLKECNATASSLLKHNVTHRANLPKASVEILAVAPWMTNPNCTLAYMDQASNDKNVQAFFFYRPDDPRVKPPPPSSNVWDLGDGGAWRRKHKYPVYIMSSSMGSSVVHELARYSGNLSTTPNADIAEKWFKDDAIIRLYAQLSTNMPSNQLPSLWVFLLIILGVLIVIMGSTSSFMHFNQRRRRSDLERRVAAGQVDLETLGVKSVTVPQETLDKFPIETYNPEGVQDEHDTNLPQPPTPIHHARSASGSNDATAVASNTPLPVSPASPAEENSMAHSPSHSTCAICLDDFEPQKTQIRILPCRHAFHPDCIDSFLLQSSCLCPLCKQSVLPKGYVPTITNYMIRRERLIRRMRAQRSDGTQMQGGGSIPPPNRPGGVSRDDFLNPAERSELRRLSTMGLITPRFGRAPRRTSTARARGSEPPTSSPQHREWARQRAAALLGINPSERTSSEENDQRPRWRRVLGSIFPTGR